MPFETSSYFELEVLLPFLQFAQILFVSLTTPPPGYGEYLELQSFTEVYDFVIVGGGTAGCVLANRLTEIADWSVLVVDAGGDPPFVSQKPGLSVLTVPALPEWNYYSEDDHYSSQALLSKKVHHITGKMLGGSSNLNFMYYVRGNKADYDSWAAGGNVGWDWENVKHYFKKIENVDKSLRNPSRGVNGYIGVSKQKSERKSGVYLKGFGENGHKILADYNSYSQLGYSPAQFFIANGTRQSASVTYLEAAKGRPNLHVLKNSLVRKVIFNNFKIAVGVEISLPDGKVITIRVKQEVILSAGAVNSPQLLMLSGIGPKQHLAEMGIGVIHDSVNVGENLQDHMMIHVMLTGKEDSKASVKKADILSSLGEFPIPSLLGFAALNKLQTYPDYQVTLSQVPKGNLMNLVICSQILQLNNETCLKFLTAGSETETLQALMALLHPESRGSIRLRSKNPEDKVKIYNGYFSNPRDLDRFAANLEDYLKVINTSTFRSFDAKVVDIGVKQCRRFKFATREYWKCYILNTVSSHYHLVGTCAMGPEGRGVVDERLKVRGVRGLRVVDASIMPTITSGNTDAPIIMIAEKAADMIKQDKGRLYGGGHIGGRRHPVPNVFLAGSNRNNW